MYRISFYGDRKPETVPDEKGHALYADWQKGTIPERVEVRTGLTIERRTIRDIEFIIDRLNELMLYTKVELKQFQETKLKVFLNDQGALTPAKELAFLVAQGLIEVIMDNKEGDLSTYRTASDATLYVKSDRTADYATMVEKLSQWKTYNGQRAYAERKHIEQLDELAAQVVV